MLDGAAVIAAPCPTPSRGLVMAWWELLLAALVTPGGVYAVWFLLDCYRHGDFHVPDPPR